MSRFSSPNAITLFLLAVCLLGSSTGCWAPFRAPAIPASQLPEEFRTPFRTIARPLNYSSLTVPPPMHYTLGPGDVLEVSVPDLFVGAEYRPIRATVMGGGIVQLPLVDPIVLNGMTLIQAQQAITKAYADGYINNPRISVELVEKSPVDVVVLGNVAAPGVYPLAKFQNDVGHALAAAGGLGKDAATVVEVHRRIVGPQIISTVRECEQIDLDPGDPKRILRIPLRGMPSAELRQEDVILGHGDVVLVPNRKQDVFFVVGELDDSNLVRFTLGDRERELGSGLILPRDRDIDVVTAVAMAGYIDPIRSPTTVTVHRTVPGCEPMLIHVDLIAARYDRLENIYVQPGDIIYLNPDSHWYFRRLFDRIVDDLILIPYARLLFPRD